MVYQKIPRMLWYTRRSPGCYGIPEDPQDANPFASLDTAAAS